MLLIAIDTSASMDHQTLVQVVQEVAQLAAHADITMVECDYVIRPVYPFTGEIRSLCGRRCTDLRPVFAPGFLAQHRVAGVVYFTDGAGVWLPNDPGIPTLWVLTDRAAGFGCPWGRRVWMQAANSFSEGLETQDMPPRIAFFAHQWEIARVIHNIRN